MQRISDERSLFDRVSRAAEVAGWPWWPDPDEPGRADLLWFVPSEAGDDRPCWALVPVALDEWEEPVVPAAGTTVDPEEIIVLDLGLAAELLRAHLRGWLLKRGWQVQVRICKKEPTWRLVDCLSIADGGGDRLDDDYPYGEDELDVLCRSVEVIDRAMAPVGRPSR